MPAPATEGRKIVSLINFSIGVKYPPHGFPERGSSAPTELYKGFKVKLMVGRGCTIITVESVLKQVLEVVLEL